MDAQYIPSLEELERMEHRRDFALFGISLLILGFAIASFPLFVLPNVRGLLPPNEPMRMPEALVNGLAALLEVGVLLCGYGIVVIGIGYLALRSLERVCDGFGSGTIRREQLKERREILLRVHSIYSRAIESGEVTLKDWCFLFPGDPAADNAWSRRSPEWGRVGACKECGHTKFWVVHTSNWTYDCGNNPVDDGPDFRYCKGCYPDAKPQWKIVGDEPSSRSPYLTGRQQRVLFRMKPRILKPGSPIGHLVKSPTPPL